MAGWEWVGYDGFIVAGGEHDDRADEDGAESGYLGVRHGVVEVELGIDADELHEEAADAAEQEVLAGEETKWEKFAATSPEPVTDDDGEEELVDRRGLDEGVGWVGWNEGVPLHMDAPGERGVDTVVAIAGSEAAEATDAVADGGGGSGEVEHAHGRAMAGKAVGLGKVSLEHEHGNAGQEAAEPSETSLEPMQEAEHNVYRMVPGGKHDLVVSGHEFTGILELVPRLGAGDSGEGDEGDDAEGVSIYAVTHEVLVQHNRRADGGEPK